MGLTHGNSFGFVLPANVHSFATTGLESAAVTVERQIGRFSLNHREVKIGDRFLKMRRRRREA